MVYVNLGWKQDVAKDDLYLIPAWGKWDVIINIVGAHKHALLTAFTKN